jgi:FkbH-like protein
VQLIGKTNQFKLNPTLFTHEQIRENAAGTFALRLTDRLQDYGIVAVVVTEFAGDALFVRNWVMSCRVFSRRLEHAVRHMLANHAAQGGANRIVLPFVSSAKNALVPSILSELGFADPAKSGDYSGSAAVPDGVRPHHMTVRDLRERAAQEYQ